jgi:hypothetical protein
MFRPISASTGKAFPAESFAKKPAAAGTGMFLRSLRQKNGGRRKQVCFLTAAGMYVRFSE